MLKYGVAPAGSLGLLASCPENCRHGKTWGDMGQCQVSTDHEFLESEQFTPRLHAPVFEADGTGPPAGGFLYTEMYRASPVPLDLETSNEPWAVLLRLNSCALTMQTDHLATKRKTQLDLESCNKLILDAVCSRH